MRLNLKERKNLIIFSLIFLAIIPLVLIVSKYTNQDQLSDAAAMLRYDHLNAEQKALINTYFKEIQESVDEYYKPFYTISPNVDITSVFFDKVRLEAGTTYISFLVHPFLGAHNTVGEDLITFSASPNGNIKLENMKHLKSFDLPKHLEGLEIKKAS